MKIMKNLRPADWSLYLVADLKFIGSRDVLDVIRQAVEGGVTAVQLRAKDIDAKRYIELSRQAAALLNPPQIPLIINDFINVALACNAAGVHLGQEDLPLPSARKVLGDEKIIGISVSRVEEALEAERGGADYVGAGPVFATTSKETTLPAIGLEGIRTMREKINIPIIAIGGITEQNAMSVIEAGASGIAVISAILSEKNVRDASQRLLRALRRA